MKQRSRAHPVRGQGSAHLGKLGHRTRSLLRPSRGHGQTEGGRVNLEQLRKQAKELVRAARAGDRVALSRLAGREPMLANAQLVLAREHGFRSWPALVADA